MFSGNEYPFEMIAIGVLSFEGSGTCRVPNSPLLFLAKTQVTTDFHK